MTKATGTRPWRLDGVTAQAMNVLARAERGLSQHFGLDGRRVEAAATRLAERVRPDPAAPDADLPLVTVWRDLRERHPEALDGLASAVQHLDPRERARCGLDLAVLAALLDPAGGASPIFLQLCAAFAEGRLAAVPQATGARLEADGLVRWLISDAAGQIPKPTRHRLDALVEGLRRDRVLFGTSARFGLFLDTLLAEQQGGLLDVGRVAALLGGMDAAIMSGSVWATAVRGLGDVWRLPGLVPDLGQGDLVPFHAVLQALLLAMVEPLDETGLAFVDETQLGVPATAALARQMLRLRLLRPRHAAVTRLVHPPGSDIVVEMRALSLGLVERLGEQARARLGVDAKALPNVRLLAMLETLAAEAADVSGGGVAILDGLL